MAKHLASAVLLISMARADGFGPFDSPNHPVTSDVRGSVNAGRPASSTHPLRLGFLIYRGIVGAYQGPRCPHRPSCSVYAMQALERHGLLLGSWLAAGRLLRYDTSSGARKLRRGADGLLADPLESSTFWLKQPGHP